MTAEHDPQFEALKSRLQQNPDSLIFARVADGLLQKGQVEEAIRVCEEGIRKHPYYVTGHMVLGKCYLQKKLFDLAEKEFKRVILFDPKYIAAHKFYGDLMREVGWDNTCEMSYRKILQIDPLDRNAREMLETLERVKPKDQEIVTAKEEKIEDYTAQAEEALPADSPFALDEPEMSASPEEQVDKEPEPGAAEQQVEKAQTINVDDDLFAELSSEEAEETFKIDEKEEVSESELTGVLDSIFDEDSIGVDEEPAMDSTGAAPEPEATETEEPDQEPEPEQPMEQQPGQEQQVAEQFASPPPEDAPGTEPARDSAMIEEKEDDADIDPLAALDNFEDETIEFDQMRDIEEQADAHLKSIETSEMEIFSPPEQTANEEDEDAFAPDLAEPPEPDFEKTPPARESATNDTAAPLDGISFTEEPETNFTAPEPEAGREEPFVAPDFQEEPPAGASEPADDLAPAEEETPQTQEKVAGAPTQTQEARPMTQQAPKLDREKIVTPTLGEIYAAQGQYAKAISVFEVLLKKDPENQTYQEKIGILHKRMEESQNA